MSQSEHANTTFILSRFPNLKMIYLHGNKISSLTDLSRLTLLPNLYSLTLHGWVIWSILHRKYAWAPTHLGYFQESSWELSQLQILCLENASIFKVSRLCQRWILSSIWTFFLIFHFPVTEGEREVKPRSRSRKQKKASLWYQCLAMLCVSCNKCNKTFT